MFQGNGIVVPNGVAKPFWPFGCQTGVVVETGYALGAARTPSIPPYQRGEFGVACRRRTIIIRTRWARPGFWRTLAVGRSSRPCTAWRLGA